MSKNKRGSRLINCRVQRAFLYKFLVHWFLSVVMVFGISIAAHLLFKSPEETYGSILGDMKNRYSLTMFVLFALIPYFLKDLIELTHRVVGPMVRLRDLMKKASRGESVAPLKFRDGDFWQELADDFNTLTARITALETELERVSKPEFTEVDEAPDDAGDGLDVYEVETPASAEEVLATT